MSLKLRSFLIFFFGSIFSILLLIILSYIFLLRSFEKLEINEAKEKLVQIKEIVNDEIEKNINATVDWAMWDDTYYFVNNKNQLYIKSNLQNQTFSNTGWNFIYFLNNKKEIIYKKGYDSKKLIEFEPANEIINYLSKNPKWQNLKNEKDNISGLAKINEKYAMVSALPILKSDASGPANGILITGFFLDEEFLKRIEKKAQKEVLIINEKNTQIETKEFNYQYKDKDSLISSRNINKLTNYIFFKDINNNFLFALKVYYPRLIYQQGIKSLIYFLAFFLSIIAIVLLIFYFFYYSSIIKRLDILLSQVKNITQKKDFSLRITNLPTDEFGVLGININQMLNALEELKKETDRKSLFLEKQNKDLDDLKKAMLNILEDEREAKEELKKQKENIEKIVEERTSELKKANEQIIESWLRLKTSINNLPLGIIFISLDHKIIVANHKINEIFDFDKNEEITCEKIANCLPEVDLLKQCQISYYDKKIVKLPKINYKNKILKIMFIPVLKQDEVIGSIFLVEDITEEENLQRARDEFFSIASHELRTPLTAIRGNTSMILEYFKDQIKDKNLFEMINDIHSSSIRLIEIVNDFLNVSRLEMGKMSFKIEKTNIEKIIDEAIKEINEIAQEKNLYLKKETEENLPLVLADGQKTKEVLINLIGNGIKFTEKGGITIKAENYNNQFIKIFIIDTGIGIPEKNQSLLFKKFQQAQENILTRDTTKSSGLGLYISKLMIENMKGEIKLEKSEVGKGSVFSFTLPVANEKEKQV